MLGGNDNQQLSTSFLDILACALGALSLLLFILASLTHQGASAKARPKSLIEQSEVPSPKAAKGKPTDRLKPRLYRVEHPQCTFKYLGDDGAVRISVSSDNRIAILRIGIESKDTLRRISADQCAFQGEIVVIPIRDPLQHRTCRLFWDKPTELKYHEGKWCDA